MNPRKSASHRLSLLFAVAASLLTLASLFPTTPLSAQIHRVSDTVRQADLERNAEIVRMVRVPMRDGVHLATEIYLPKERSGPVPVISTLLVNSPALVRTSQRPAESSQRALCIS